MSMWQGEQNGRPSTWRGLQYLNPILWLLAAFWTTTLALIWRTVIA
jgi:hypothetical protein